MNPYYYDPFLTPEREEGTLYIANLYAKIASEAYMLACDAGLDALESPEVVWLDQETGEEWRDEEGRTWPEHVCSLDGFVEGRDESWINSPITGPLAKARKWWGAAMRVIEALPDPRGSYESNCRGWPGHKAPCCARGNCQTWGTVHDATRNVGPKFGHSFG